MDRTEDGMVVQVYGVVADTRLYESGYTSMLLADHASGDTIQVLFQPHSVRVALSEMSIGDEVLVEGTVSLEPPRATVFADAENARILSKAAFVMSVGFLCSNWRLFEFDRFNVSGAMVAGPDSGGLWLMDPFSGHRIRLAYEPSSAGALHGTDVVVDCTLLMDFQTMSLYLRAWGVEPVAT